MDPIETLLVTTFTGTIGSPIAIGIIVMLMFVILGVCFRLNTGAFLIILLPLTFALYASGLLPAVVLYVALMACAFVIYMAVRVVIR